MRIYFNSDNINFRETVRSDIYVDKTMMLSILNKNMDRGNKYICISRPRRFGKTIAGNMICAYYSKGCDSRELFAPFRIASDPSFHEKLNQYNVIYVDLNSEYQMVANKEGLLSALTKEIKAEMQEQFPQIPLSEEDSLAKSILRIYAKTGETFVIIMDEYDVLIRENVKESLLNEYLGFLNSLFKSNTLRPAIALAYLTGILPIVRDRVQSKLNNFREYTILDAGELAEFVGFTAEEVEALCSERGLDFEEFRKWYDGYRQHNIEIYNPESVIRAAENGYFDDYWGRTSTYAVISDQLKRNFEGTRDAVIQMLAGEDVPVNVTSYMNTMDSFYSRNDLFTYLLHLGYLAYNMEEKTCRIPNREIRQEWLNAVEVSESYSETNRIIEESRELLKETLAGNDGAVARALDVSHIHVTSNRSYNNEDALQSAIYLAYLYALNKYTVIREMTTGKGFADVVYIPYDKGDPAMIIELKRNSSTESALQQIKEKRYFDSLSLYKGELLFVGISYDEKEKTHDCKIEWFQK